MAVVSVFRCKQSFIKYTLRLTEMTDDGVSFFPTETGTGDTPKV